MRFFIALWLSVTFSSIGADPAEVCPDAWSMYEGFCFWSTHFAAKWDLAEDICNLASPNSSPASVHSVLQNAGLNEGLFGQLAWLGLRRGDDDEFRWSDGTDVAFTYWDNNQPDASGDCTVMNVNNITGQWGTAACDQEYPITCRQRAVICPDKWTAFGRACYRYISRSVEWTSVAEECASLHSWKSEPVSIHSDDANNFIKSLRPSQQSSSVWIGLSGVSGNNSLHWADGSALDYENWDSATNNGYYVLMEYDGKWDYATQYTRSCPFICQIRL